MNEIPPEESQFTLVEVEDTTNVVERLVRAYSLFEAVVKEADAIEVIESFGQHIQSRRADFGEELMVLVNKGLRIRNRLIHGGSPPAKELSAAADSFQSAIQKVVATFDATRAAEIIGVRKPKPSTKVKLPPPIKIKLSDDEKLALSIYVFLENGIDNLPHRFDKPRLKAACQHIGIRIERWQEAGQHIFNVLERAGWPKTGSSKQKRLAAFKQAQGFTKMKLNNSQNRKPSRAANLIKAATLPVE